MSGVPFGQLSCPLKITVCCVHCSHNLFTLNSEDDFLRKLSSLFKITETELPRLELPIFGGFLPNYQDRDRLPSPHVGYRAHLWFLETRMRKVLQGTGDENSSCRPRRPNLINFPIFNEIQNESRAGHFRYFLIFSLIKNDFFHFLSS